MACCRPTTCDAHVPCRTAVTPRGCGETALNQQNIEKKIQNKIPFDATEKAVSCSRNLQSLSDIVGVFWNELSHSVRQLSLFIFVAQMRFCDGLRLKSWVINFGLAYNLPAHMNHNKNNISDCCAFLYSFAIDWCCENDAVVPRWISLLITETS